MSQINEFIGAYQNDQTNHKNFAPAGTNFAYIMRGWFVKATLLICLLTIWAVWTLFWIGVNFGLITGGVLILFSTWWLVWPLLSMFVGSFLSIAFVVMSHLWHVSPKSIENDLTWLMLKVTVPLLDFTKVNGGQYYKVQSNTWLDYISIICNGLGLMTGTWAKCIKKYQEARGNTVIDVSFRPLPMVFNLPKGHGPVIDQEDLRMLLFNPVDTHSKVSIWDDDAFRAMGGLNKVATSFQRMMAVCSINTATLVFTLPVFVVILVANLVVMIARFGLRRINDVLANVVFFFSIIGFVWLVPYPAAEFLLYFAAGIVWMLIRLLYQVAFNPFQWYAAFKFFKFIATTVIPVWVIASFDWSVRLVKGKSSRRSPFARKSRLSARFNSTWVSMQRVIADLNLPDFIKTSGDVFSIEGLQETLEKMKDIGWPVNVTVESFLSNERDLFPGWQIGTMDFEQGMRRLEAYVDEQLKEIEQTSPDLYKRSETYMSYENELRATSRYFIWADFAFPEIQTKEVWVLLGDIFDRSKLTPFAKVIKKWEKSYGLGAWAKRRGFHGDTKLSRKAFMSTISKDSFASLWAETFRIAPTLTPINAVSVKREALPPKKWMADKVRTVIGSFLPDYIMSTMFNYAPNHNFKPFTTPVKIGLRLNGFGMSTVWSRHSLKDYHFAGDCSDFDSTLSGAILEIIKNVRKQGFVNHKDFARI